jgi:hypothetical protein
MTYKVIRHVSIKDGDGWAEFKPGTPVEEWPKGTDVEELLRIGAIEEVTDGKTKRTRR